MVFRIVKKEILESLLSLRFMLSSVLVVLVFATSGFVFVANCKQQLLDYQEGTSKNTASLREGGGGRGRGPALREEETDPGGASGKPLYELAFLEQDIWRRPKALSMCVGGSERSLPNRFGTTAFGMGRLLVKRPGNFLLRWSGDMDWAFIVSVLLSFMALLLTYDAFSGEREAGTLRLLLSAAIPRDKVLTGKYLGVMLTLGIPFAAGAMVHMLIVRSYGIAAITAGDWLKILVIVLISFAYLSFFVLLGLLVSGRAQHSVSSMVILLLVWVGLVVLVPSSGRLAARAFGDFMPRAELARKVAEATQEIWANSARYGERAGTMAGDRDDPRNNPPARAKLKRAVTQAKNQLREEYLLLARAQATLGRQFTRVSPVVMYQIAAETIAGTGIRRCFDIYDQLKEYRAALMDYIRAKDQEDPESLHLICEERSMATRWQAISHQPVDFESIPKFRESDMPMGEALKSAIWDVGLLVALNVVLFAAAHVSFSRYDVR